MKKIYKYLLLVVAIVIIIGTDITSAFALELTGSGSCGEGIMWELTSDGTLTISGSGVMSNFFAEDSPWYSKRDDIHSVIISSGVTNIGANAFFNCSNLLDVDISDTVTIIGAAAFADCTSLTEIRFGSVIDGSIDFHWSPLSKASIENIVSVLSDDTEDLTVTFGRAHINSVYEEAEWEQIVALKPNWVFALI